MIKQTLLLFILSYSCLAAADSDRDLQFRHELRANMEKYFGANAIQAEQYFAIPPSMGLGSARPTNVIVHSLGYVQLKNNLLCHVGLGYSRSESGHPLKTALAECLPINQGFVAEGSTLQERFNDLRTKVLSTADKLGDFLEKANSSLVPVFKDPNFNLAIYPYDITERTIQPAWLFYFEEPDASAQPTQNPKFATVVTIQFEIGPKRGFIAHVPVWELEIASGCNELTTKFAQQEPLNRHL